MIGSGRGFKVAKVLLVVSLAISVTGLVVMSLWNWLLPPLTGWHALSFAQALGLFVLCRILFGGLRGGGRFGHRHARTLGVDDTRGARAGARRNAPALEPLCPRHHRVGAMSTTASLPVPTTTPASLQATIDVAPLSSLLARLHADARRDPLRVAPFIPAATIAYMRGGATGLRRVKQAATDTLYRALSPAQGRFIYLIARAINAQTIVEFGASYGVSTLYLAAAAYDNFGGRVISTERSPAKAARARTHLDEAGLAPWVDLRVGDALDTLARDLPRQIDMVVLDGERRDYRAVLELLRDRLRPGGIVLAPRVQGVRREAGRLIDELRCGTAGFQSTTLPYGDGLEFTVVV